MSDPSESYDPTAAHAVPEEFVLPGDVSPEELAPAPATAPPLMPVAPGARVTRPSWNDRRVASKLRARKVRRLVRHVEPWSVLKISLIFYFCLWVILLIAGVLLWNLAVSSGTVDNLEQFVTQLFALESFTLNADQIFRASAIGGLVLVVAASGFTVLMAVLFNLISDLTGGMRFTVVEEETARPRPKRIRPRKNVMQRVGGLVAPAPSQVSSAPGLADFGQAAAAPTDQYDELGVDPAYLPDDPVASAPVEHEVGILGDEVPILSSVDETDLDSAASDDLVDQLEDEAFDGDDESVDSEVATEDDDR